MDKKQFEVWFKKLGKAWVNLGPEVSASLFSKDVEYYESVLGEPCTSWEEMAKLWEVVPTNQKNVSFDFQVVATSGNIGIANWWVTRTMIPSEKKQKIDGIFLVSLNDEGLCDLFKQWRTTEEY